MNMAEYTSSWQSAAGAAEECQYLNQLGGPIPHICHFFYTGKIFEE